MTSLLTIQRCTHELHWDNKATPEEVGSHTIVTTTVPHKEIIGSLRGYSCFSIISSLKCALPLKMQLYAYNLVA